MTKFDCGGYSIGIGTSHSLFDGISAFDFLRAWASQCQGRSQLVHIPVHERGTLLVDKDSSCVNNSTPTAIDHLYHLIRQATPNDQNQEISLIFKTFHLSAEMIENLKKKVLGEKKDKLSCSSFEVLATHLWKVPIFCLSFFPFLVLFFCNCLVISYSIYVPLHFFVFCVNGVWSLHDTYRHDKKCMRAFQQP